MHILFALLGIYASFLPWIHYPKTNADFMGYMGDGIISGFLYAIVLITGIVTFKKNSPSFILPIIYILFGITMIYWSYGTYSGLINEAKNFNPNNPVFALAAAGLSPGIGIYVLGLAGLGIVLTALATLMNNKKDLSFEKTETLDNNAMPRYGIPITILFIVGVSAFFLIKPHKINSLSSVPTNDVKASLAQGISTMGAALKSKNYTTFIDCLHPMMVQSYGGREQSIAVLQSTMESLQQKGSAIKDVKLADVFDIKNNENSMQAIVTQQVTSETNGQEKIEIQKLIAVSEDNGKSWKYININGKTKSEMMKFFPQLNQNLDF